jgi:hypothetical protein
MTSSSRLMDQGSALCPASEPAPSEWACWYLVYGIPNGRDVKGLERRSARKRDFSREFPTLPTAQIFGVNDHDSARFVSDLLGQTTVAFQTMRRALDSEKSGISLGDHLTGRPLMTPDEVRNLPGPVELLFLAGQQPIVARKPAYYQDPELDGMLGARKDLIFRCVSHIAAGKARHLRSSRGTKVTLFCRASPSELQNHRRSRL